VCGNDHEPFERILRIDEVLRLSGLSAATRWREIAAGCFPSSVPISKRGKEWLASDLRDWLARRRAGS
jgi:predicted DNA-binding transcriptional regulator AlpA